MRAIRAGRAVEDPRDAALAVAWAQRLQAVSWPGWALPRTRPSGKRACYWLAHLGLIAAVLVVVLVGIWSSLHGVWRWVVVGFAAYGLITVPWIFVPLFRTYWNAPAAERLNRELLAQDAIAVDS